MFENLAQTLVAVDALPWCINTGKSLIPLTLLFFAQKRNLNRPGFSGDCFS